MNAPLNVEHYTTPNHKNVLLGSFMMALFLLMCTPTVENVFTYLATFVGVVWSVWAVCHVFNGLARLDAQTQHQVLAFSWNDAGLQSLHKSAMRDDVFRLEDLRRAAHAHVAQEKRNACTKKRTDYEDFTQDVRDRFK